jgi:uncharacterized membrane protein
VRIAFTVLAWSYPLALHLFIYIHRLDLAAFYLAVLLAWPLAARLLTRQRPDPINIVAAILAIALVTGLRSHELIVFKFLPTIFQLVMFLVFASSLREGQVPVITRMVNLMRPAAGTAELDYSRKVTIAWAVVFLSMALVSAPLAIFAPKEIWSWFVNIGSYFVLGTMFVGEFIVRRRVLGAEVDYSFVEFLGNLIRMNPNKAMMQRDKK